MKKEELANNSEKNKAYTKFIQTLNSIKNKKIRENTYFNHKKEDNNSENLDYYPQNNGNPALAFVYFVIMIAVILGVYMYFNKNSSENEIHNIEENKIETGEIIQTDETEISEEDKLIEDIINDLENIF